LISSIFDNVPILAAIQGMYGLDTYPTDHNFWLFLAYTVGTGGSMLVIGSAAGVAIMNSEKIEFMWYVKHISFPALLGFLGGAAVYFM
jgi:Na+/H+ antiporter NhaD/arsenite permease-like protein